MAKLRFGFKNVLTGIALMGTAVVAVRYLRDMRAARVRIASLGSQVINTDCGPIEYVQIGEGYPVLVVHGAMGGFDQGLWLARNLDASNIQIISVSRFGYLRSPVPIGANLDMQADAFACLLDALKIHQVAVFAISAGSTSAIRFAARHPGRISALILLSPDAPGKVQMSLPPRIVFDTLMRSDFIYWSMATFFPKSVQDAMHLAPEGYDLTPEYKALIKRVVTGDWPISQRMDGMIFETYTIDADFKASITAASPYPLGRIKTPTLVINAMDDPISIPENVRTLADQMPEARLFLLPDGGHLLFGHAEEVKSEIAQFLLRNVAELQKRKGNP
jgi:pimeloyl-ACP methyl ester carboxylesterase